jgi:hypothetical protein
LALIDKRKKKTDLGQKEKVKGFRRWIDKSPRLALVDKRKRKRKTSEP